MQYSEVISFFLFDVGRGYSAGSPSNRRYFVQRPFGSTIHLSLSYALGKLNNKLAQLQRPHVLVIDEAGHLPLDRADANRIFQVVNRRYIRGSTIITSNKTVGEWADTFGDEALAAAILDRLLHDAEVLAINGPSYRLKGRLDALKRPATDAATA